MRLAAKPSVVWLENRYERTSFSETIVFGSTEIFSHTFGISPAMLKMLSCMFDDSPLNPPEMNPVRDHPARDRVLACLL